MRHHLPEHLRDPKREALDEVTYGSGKSVYQDVYHKTWSGTFAVIVVSVLVLLMINSYLS